MQPSMQLSSAQAAPPQKPWLDKPSLSLLFANLDATQLHNQASWRFGWSTLLNHLFPRSKFSVYLCTDTEKRPSVDLRVAGTVGGCEVPIVLLDVQAPTNISSAPIREKSEKLLLDRYNRLATQWGTQLPNPFFAISVFGQAFRVYEVHSEVEGPVIIAHEWMGVLDRPGESVLRQIAEKSKKFALVLPQYYRTLSAASLQEQLTASLAKWGIGTSDSQLISSGPLRNPIKKELTL